MLAGADFLATRCAIGRLGNSANDEAFIGDGQEIKIVDRILHHHRIADVAREVVDRRGLARFGLGHSQDKRLLWSARKRVTDPLATVGNRPAVHALRSRDRISMPDAPRIVAGRNGNIDWLELFLVPGVPKVKAKDLVVGIEKKLRVNPAVKGCLVDALDLFARLVIDHQAIIGTVKEIAPAHDDLRIDLAVAVLRAVENQQSVDFPRVAPLCSLVPGDPVVESFLAQRLDDFAADRLAARRRPVTAPPLAGLLLTPDARGTRDESKRFSQQESQQQVPSSGFQAIGSGHQSSLVQVAIGQSARRPLSGSPLSGSPLSGRLSTLMTHSFVASIVTGPFAESKRGCGQRLARPGPGRRYPAYFAGMAIIPASCSNHTNQ